MEPWLLADRLRKKFRDDPDSIANAKAVHAPAIFARGKVIEVRGTSVIVTPIVDAASWLKSARHPASRCANSPIGGSSSRNCIDALDWLLSPGFEVISPAANSKVLSLGAIAVGAQPFQRQHPSGTGVLSRLNDSRIPPHSNLPSACQIPTRTKSDVTIRENRGPKKLRFQPCPGHVAAIETADTAIRVVATR